MGPAKIRPRMMNGIIYRKTQKKEKGTKKAEQV